MIKLPSIFRYPGSKHRFLPLLVPLIERQFVGGDQRCSEYVEPFFGGGSGLSILQCLPRDAFVRINDLDPGVHAAWQAVLRHPEELKTGIRALLPSVALFDKLKDLELQGRYTGDIVKDGLHKIALNRFSVSGYGSKSGGPLGGRKQANPGGRIDARWSVPYLCEAINRASRILGRFGNRLMISCEPANDLLAKCNKEAFVYLDPPYVEMGGCLYSTNMAAAEHQKMAQLLRKTKASWLLSYDDCDWVGQAYQWARRETVRLQYSNRRESERRKECVEIFIYPRKAWGGNSVIPAVVA